MSPEFVGAAPPERFADPYRAWHRTAAQIRAGGAIGSPGHRHDLPRRDTRVVAWPGNGFQTQSIHVVTIHPGDEMEMHTYAMAEEAMLCLKGGGEAYVRGEWVDFRPGDLAFFPPRVPHVIRLSARAEQDLVAVTAISPPRFDLYADAGFYNVRYGVINDEAAFFAHQNARPGALSSDQEMRYWDTAPAVRPWNLSVEDAIQQGALFMDTYDCVFAPCGVRHGISMAAETVLWGGFAVPPQLDLYRRTDWYENGVFASPSFELLAVPDSLLPGD